MQYAESILDLVGDTPLVRISRLTRDLGPADRQPLLLAKLEMLNPGGSVKDRIGLPMIEAAERAGLLKPGGTIIEPTSGNTGHGLAIAAALKGYRCIFVMADKQSAEKQQLLRAYGAEVVLCPTNVAPESPESYYSVAARLARDIPGAFKPDQYWNAENPAAHERTTGPELWDQTDGRITHFVASVGTGGTISGAARVLKARNPAIQVIGADPEGSVLSGDAARPYLTEGVGEDFLPGTYDPSVVDRWVRVSDRDAFAMARRLTREEGILSGGSCGTAMVAALRGRPRAGRDADGRGRRRRRPAARQRPELPVEDLQRRVDARQRPAGHDRRGRPGRRPAPRPAPRRAAAATSSSPGRPSGSARPSRRSRSIGISQLPVSERPDGDALEGFVGSITEKGLLDRAFRDPSIVERTVGEVMDRPLPFVDVAASLDEAFALLSGGSSAVIATQRRAPDRRRDQARRPRVPRPPARMAAADVTRAADDRPADPDGAVRARLDVAGRSCTMLVARDLAAAEAEIGAVVPVDLPDTLDHFLQFRIADLSLDPSAQPWLGRAIVLTEPDGTRRIIGSCGFHAPPGRRRPGRGRLPGGARLPSPGRRDRGRPRPVRLGARAGRRSLPGVGLAGQRGLAGDHRAARLPPDRRPDRRHRRRGARLPARRLAAGEAEP